MVAAIDPVAGSPTARIQISWHRLHAVGSRGPAHALEAAYIVPAVLSGPTAIFEGLRWDEDEDRWGYGSRCYCGRPDRSYARDGSEGPPYAGQVYLVFINEDGVAYNWRWEKAAPDAPDLPEGHDVRFRRRLL